jgi:TPR repeat protein
MLLLAATGAFPLVAAQTPPGSSIETSAGGKSLEATHQAAKDLLKANQGEESARKGFQMMREAAEKGYLPAIAGVAYLYNVGMGTPKDNATAAKWFRLAAEKEHAISRYNLGKLLVADEIPLPEGVAERKVQHDEGVEWIRKAADQGLPDALASYGIILYRGDFGTKRDAATAAEYLKRAADAGDLEAMNVLGVMHRTGRGVPHDPGESERLYRQAAMAGHVKAQANLGEFLNPSSPNSDRRIEALAWLFIAEESEDIVAKKILAVKLHATSPDDISAAKNMAAEIKQKIKGVKK